MPRPVGQPILPLIPKTGDQPGAVGGVSTAPARHDNRSIDRWDPHSVERPFDIYFTPEEDAYAFEAKCIDEVIAARQADPTAYPEGQDPYSIHYMVYNLRNKEIVHKLFAAVRAGIDVQVLVEADQISPQRHWNKVDDWFEEQGLTVIHSDKEITDAERRGAHMIGIDRRSLMHMKSRIFRYKDPATGESKAKVLSGSLNPGGAPVHNDENVNLIVNDAVVDLYERRYYEIRDRQQATNVWHDDRPVNVLFTPYARGDVTPTKKLFEWIDQEQEMILISVFALHNLTAKGERQTLIEKLAAAKARGVRVMVITDRRKSDGTDKDGNRINMYGRPAHDDDTDELMQQAGIPVFELCNTTTANSAVHGKSVLCGLKHTKVLTGAGNWTVAAMGSNQANPKNEESFIFVDSGKLDGNYTGRAYLANFLNLLRKYDNQYDEQAEAVIGALQKLDGWPKVTLDLAPIAKAHPGKEVFLISEHPAVKVKVRDGEPGLRIDTSPQAGTPQFAADSNVELPFGSHLTFQVAVRDPDTGQIHLTKRDQIVVVDTPGHG